MPQWMNMPKRASRHHAMRASRCAAVSLWARTVAENRVESTSPAKAANTNGRPALIRIERKERKAAKNAKRARTNLCVLGAVACLALHSSVIESAVFIWLTGHKFMVGLHRSDDRR